MDRLCVLAALHDFGKANAGFQQRWAHKAPFVGHCREGLAALLNETLRARLFAILPLTEICGWGAFDGLLVALGHHGRPLAVDTIGLAERLTWKAVGGYDPVAALAPLGAAVRTWFPNAFASGGQALPQAPRFWHAISGYLTFADWLGSDETMFPLDGADEGRMALARQRASRAVAAIGFDPTATRRAIGAPKFARLSPYPPRTMQLAAGEAPGHLAILESETGSGKTEAALWRFARLFADGEVDGLYFAVPTRVAAVSLHRRVCEAIAGLFSDPAARPHVTLAVPGMSHAPAPNGEGLTQPAPDATEFRQESEAAARWASERPKRFLAGTIAVGTIDQALLGAIKVKHAHLRAACLLRHLLVVDEVHASDAYMGRLLEHLLAFHVAAGGHALLLSATLGAAARTRFLHGRKAQPPSLEAAVASPYPALWSEASPKPIPQPDNGRARGFAMTLVNEMSDPAAIAARALVAARAGAKVLVVRNLRSDAIAVFRTLKEQGGDDLLLRCRGVATLHHGRFAREDRTLLDEAVEAALGPNRAPGGLVAIGTQTLEQSLDIDADVLITDLCPADVLLQRLGRLHRHTRPRPTGFERPRAVVLAPDDLAMLIKSGRHGLGFFRRIGENIAFPYPDLVAVEATRRLIVDHPVWSIPAMNRMLVESATHPQARAGLLETLEPRAAWAEADTALEGRSYAYLRQAMEARLPFDLPFSDPGVVFPQDERLGARLGARDLIATFDPPAIGPFGTPVTSIAIPDHLAKGIDPADDLTARVATAGDGTIRFAIQAATFLYDACGLGRDLQHP